MSDTRGFLRGNVEKLKLFGYFAVMVFVSGPLFQTLGEAWKSSVLIRPLIGSLRPIASVTLEEFTMFWLGFYLGLLLLMTLDPKKRWQAVLLWVGTVTAVLALAQIGLLLPSLDPTRSYGWALVGGAVGALAGGGRQLGNINTAEPMEFRQAANTLYSLVLLIVVVGLLEYHVVLNQVLTVTRDGLVIQLVPLELSFDSDGLFRNVAVAGTFLYTMNRFVEYDAETEFFVLGPPGSGKSLFLVGTYMAALDRVESNYDATPLRPTQELMRLVGSLDDADPEAGWNLDATGDKQTSDLQFTYVAGDIFPKNITVSSLDYAGEYLRQLPDALLGDTDEVDGATLTNLTNRVQRADTLIFLVDCERFERGDKMDIEPYFDILDSAPDKRVLLVASKADILADRFREERSLEPHDYPEDFREYVHTTLTENDQQVRTLVQETGGRLFPVYYQTKLSDDGERVPLRDRHGNVLTNGFDELVTALD